MEFAFNAIVMMMLIGFPLGLILGTLDLYTNRISSGAVRHVQHAFQPKVVVPGSGLRPLGASSIIGERRGLPGRTDSGSRPPPAAPTSERLGGDAARTRRTTPTAA